MLLSFFLRLLLLVAGLVFAASVAVLVAAMAALWLLRAAWAKLTGRSVTPFVVRMGAGRAFEEMMRRAPASEASRTPRADSVGALRPRVADVTDVEPRPPH